MLRDNPTEIVREAYRRWIESGGTDPDSVMDLIADDVDWEVLGNGRAGCECTGRCAGKAEMIAFLVALNTDWAMEDYTIDEVIGTGERVIVVGSIRFRSRKTGHSFFTPKVDVLTVRDGQIVAGKEIFDTGAMAEAALSPAG
ncbi:MAG: nuclear transport factor 2 family protein [Pseudomonadota bacterium]